MLGLTVLRRWWPFPAVIVLLAVAGMSASMTGIPLSRVAVGAGSGDDSGPRLEEVIESPADVPVASDTGLTVPGAVVQLLLGVGAAVIVVVLALLIGANLRSGSRFRRRAVRRKGPDVSVTQSRLDAEVVAALEAGLDELDEADADPRRAVIACWVRLERAAGAAGTPRLPGDTSTDLVLRLLEGHRLSAPVLTAFADVYRLARFAPRHTVDEQMREQAKTALWRLRGELTGVPA